VGDPFPGMRVVPGDTGPQGCWGGSLWGEVDGTARLPHLPLGQQARVVGQGPALLAKRGGYQSTQSSSPPAAGKPPTASPPPPIPAPCQPVSHQWHQCRGVLGSRCQAVAGCTGCAPWPHEPLLPPESPWPPWPWLGMPHARTRAGPQPGQRGLCLARGKEAAPGLTQLLRGVGLRPGASLHSRPGGYRASSPTPFAGVQMKSQAGNTPHSPTCPFAQPPAPQGAPSRSCPLSTSLLGGDPASPGTRSLLSCGWVLCPREVWPVGCPNHRDLLRSRWEGVQPPHSSG